MRTRARPFDYLLATALAAVSLSVRWLLQPWLGPLQPFAPGFVVIAASVLILGWRPAVITALVSYVGGTYLFVQHGGVVWWTRPQDLAAAITFGVSAGLIIFMGHWARRAERQLEQANEELRAADRRKDEFLATLSHELRNPIGVISTAAALLHEQEEDPRRRAMVATMSRQAALIRRLVDDLLDVGRITRGRLALQKTRIDVRTCVHHAVDGTLHLLERKQQTMQVALPDSAIEMNADHARLVQVLTNLIDNASKYSPEGAEINVALTDGEHVTLIVTDTGPGIAPDILPRVFELFDQGGSSASGGLGLGLGLCKRIVELHGGSIAAQPNSGGAGTSFIVRLPKQI